MTWWAVGSAVIGGVMSSNSASEGIDAQTEAAAKSDATQRYMYDTTRADNAPFLKNGTNASNRLAHLMGLGGSGGGSQGTTAEQYRTQLLPQYTKTIAGTPGTPATATQHPGRGADEFEQWVYSGGSGATPASSQVDEVGLNNAIQQALSTQQAGQQAAQSDPSFGSLTRKFNASDLAGDVVYQNGLQFGLSEGAKGINNQAAATGSMLSGATLKALTRFGNDYATTKTEGAYNRYTQDNTNIYNKLAGISGTGQVASSQVGSAGQSYANNVSNNATNLGNARAASGIASTNAISGGLQGGVNNYQGNQMLEMLRNRGGSGVSPWAPATTPSSAGMYTSSDYGQFI